MVFGFPLAVLSKECLSGDESCISDLESDTASLLQVGRQSLEVSGTPPMETEEKCGPRKAKTPQDYVDCWKDAVYCCVHEDLLGSVMGPNPTPDDTLYPPNRTFAWAGTYTDLETGLRLRKKFGLFDSETTLGLEVAVGFNPVMQTFDPDAGKNDPGFSWLVFEKPPLSIGASPTWAYFFEYFQQEAGINFDYDVVKEILLTYANLEWNGAPYDVVQAWSKLTGCCRECSAPGTGVVKISKKCGCNDDVVKAWKVVKPWMEDETPGNSKQCFKALSKKFKHPTAGQIRVAFHACNDMLPVFTGFGLGYNTLVNPLKCDGAWSCKHTVNSRYGGQEYVFPNDPLSDLNKTGSARFINLAQVKEKDMKALTNTFC